MSIQNLMSQLSKSKNPMSMVMNMLPNQNLKTTFSNLMNSGTDEEKAQKIADLCNQNGITKRQLINALNNQKR